MFTYMILTSTGTFYIEFLTVHNVPDKSLTQTSGNVTGTVEGRKL